MSYCVLVKISKRMVSFWYQSERSSYAPLIIKETNEVPLYFYVNGNDFIFGNAARDRFYSNDPKAFGNYFEIIKDPSKHFSIYGNKKPVKQLFYYGIEQYLSHFINTVLYKSDSIESYRQYFPLRFLFETDIEDKEKLLIETLFIEAGYDNVERIDGNDFLFKVLYEKGILKAGKSVLLLNGIDNTLYLELYKNIPGALSAFSTIEGQGADPRVKILADMIIEYITAQNPYLSIDKEIEANSLLLYTANLLENITPIIKGDAVLTDGQSYWFRVNERNLNDRLLYYSNDSIIYAAIDDLLKSNSISIDNVIILLGSEEINTSYFSNKLLNKYPNVKGVDTSHNIDTMKLIFYKIAESGYSRNKKTPDAPPILPKPNISPKGIEETKKPELPPDEKKVSDKSKVALPPILPAKKEDKTISGNGINKPPLPDNNNLNRLLGKLGVVTSQIFPTGKIEIEKNEYEAISENIKLDKGVQVKVVGVTGKKYLKVEKAGLPPLPPKKKTDFEFHLN